MPVFLELQELLIKNLLRNIIMLKIAIQKSGRLYEDSVKLLKECGIELNNGNKQLKAVAFNFPLEVYFLRDDDIPQYVEDSVAHIGIVGENVLFEKEKSYDAVRAIDESNARKTAKLLATEEGIFVGTSSGLNVFAAIEIGKELGPGKTVVTVAADSGMKYLAGDLFD